MKKRNVVIAALLAATTLVTSAAPVMAADETTSYTYPGGEKQISVPVEVMVSSNYTVTVPKKIVLTKTEGSDVYTSTYMVNVKGDIAGDEHVTVAIKNEDVALKQTGKTDVTAHAAIDPKSFSSTDLVGEGTNINGTVSVAALSSGTWTGDVEFTASLQ